MKKFTQKLAFLLMALWCVVGVPIQAAEVTIGNEASTSYSTYVPFYTYFNYGYSQQIFTADEIGLAGTINSLTMWMYNTGSLSSFDVAIYMVEVPEGAFASNSSWATLSASDLVYSGSLTNIPSSAATAVTITLDNPFSYSGSGNLLLAIANNTGDYSSGFNCRVDDAPNGANMSLYTYRDSPGAYDVTNPPTSGNLLAKRNVITLDITASGSGPTCERVETVEVSDIAARQATVNWTGGGGTYLLEYKLASADKYTAIENVTGTSYTLQNLTPNTAYNVRVSNVCGPENVSSARSANFNTIIGLPYEENFNGSSIPSGWTQNNSGLLNDNGSVTPASSSYNWNYGTANGVFDNHAKINVYSTVNSWLITPVLPMEAGYQLTFDFALTAFSGTLVAPAQQADARFVVAVTSDGGDNWSILREWNNTGSEYVFNDITYNSAEGEAVELDLSAYASQSIQIAFYVHHASGGDNELHLDNVKIAPVPTCLKPTNLHEIDGKATKSSVQVAWTAESGESAWKLKYKKASDADAEENWTTLPASTNPFTISNLETFTEYNVLVAADCGGGDISEFSKKAITVKTAAGVPFAQGFNVPSLPSDWKRYEAGWEDVENGEPLEPVSAGWAIASSSTYKNGVFPDSTSHLYLNVKGDNTNHWIISPVIEMEADYELSFNLALTTSSGTLVAPTAGAQNDDKFIVAINDGTGWTPLREWTASSSYLFDGINATANGQTVKLNLNSYAGESVQIAFYGESSEANGDNNLHISAVKIAPIPNCQPALSLNISGITGTTATAAWTADEAGTWQYGYTANPADDFAPADADFEHETTNMSVDLSGLSEVTDYIFYVRRKCGDDVYSDYLIVPFHTIQTPVTLDGDHSYMADFEESNDWLLINGTQTNQWAYGTATSSSGTSSLYISNDGGESNAMSATASAHTSYVYATKTFTFAESGVYTFSYDWKCNGSSSYAYLRVYLAPVSEEPAAGSSTYNLSGLIPLHTASSLYGQTDWQQETFEYRIEEAGTYKVILYWYNYYSSYSTYSGPAAVDNIAISRLACPKPEGLNITEVGAESASFSWNDATDGSFEYAYALASVEMPEEFIPVVETSVTIGSLTELTDYKFYLRKSCSETEKSAIVSVNFTTRPLPLSVPWSENFDQMIASTVPAYWDNSASTSSTLAGNPERIWGVYEYGGNKMLRMYNYYVQSGTALINTPQINLPASPAQSLSFEYSHTATCGNFTLKISQDGGATWTALESYDKTSSGTDNTNPGTFTKAEEISLADYAGKTIMLQFFANANFGSGAIFVDSISIYQTPSCQTPLGLKAVADSITTTSAVLTWTPKGDETNWLVRYRKAGEEAWNTPIAVAHVEGHAADSLKIEGLDPASTYEAQVAAAGCDPEDEEAISDYSASISFNTECAAIAALSENFDAIDAATTIIPGLPNCWSRINTSSSSDYNVYPYVIDEQETYAHSGASFLYFVSRYGSSYNPQDQYVVLPELISTEGLRIKFNARKQGASYEDTYAVVGIMTDPADAATFQYLDSIQIVSEAYIGYAVPFTAYSGEGKYVAIVMPAAKSSYATLLIDDIIIEEIPSCLEPSGLAAALTSGNGSIATLSWSAGADETAWVVEYSANADFSEAISQNVSENPTLDLSGLTAETVYYARVKAVCSEDNVSPWSDVISFMPTNKHFIIVNDGTSTNTLIPIGSEATDMGAHSQFIIPASDLASIQWGTINELTFYSSTASYNWEDAEFEVYLSQAPATTFSSAALNDWSSMTKVMDAASLTVVDNQMVVTFTTPYQYEGGNLLVGFKETEYGAYGECSWYGVSASNAAVGTAYDWEYGDLYLSRESFLPKMKIEYTPGEAPSCLKPTALAVVESSISSNSAIVTWTPQGEEANWLVRYRKSGSETWNTPIAVAHIEGNEADSVVIEGLAAASTYEVQVAAVCDPSDEEAVSEYSASMYFTTGCGVISAFPWEENFNSLTAGIPVCWDNAEGTTTTESYKWNSYESGHEGRGLRFNSYSNSSNNTNFLKTPNFTISKASILSFYYKNPNGGDFSVFYSVRGGAQTALATGLTGASNWTLKEITLPAGCISDSVVFIFKGTSNYGYSDAYIYLDDVALEEMPDCSKPTGLAMKDITADGGTFFWNRDEATAWQYAVAPAAAEEPSVFIDVTDTFAIVNSLNDNTDYFFYVRKNCGGSSSPSIKASFHTLQLPVAVGNSFADDFEGENSWLLLNGDMTNAWVHGTAAHNGEESTKALYVSNDGGATNAYTHSAATIYATKAFTFAEGAYVFQYDWKANGESSYDLLRVALVPADAVLVAGSAMPAGLSSTSGNALASELPAGWIALDGGTKLNLRTAWATYTTAELSIAAGTYNVVFLWRNDGSSGSQTPAAVDNFSISKVLCSKPTALACPTKTAHSATLKWKAEEGQDTWLLAIDTISGFNPDTLASSITVHAADTPYVATGLLANKSYYAYVRALCGGENGNSAWSSKLTFATPIANARPTNVISIASALTATQARISWKGVATNDLHENYEVYYSRLSTIPADADLSADSLFTEIADTTIVLSSLSAETKYYVWVRDNCGADGYSAWTAINFTTASLCQTPSGVAASEIGLTSATITWNTFGQSDFNLRYKAADATDWTVVSNVSTPYVLEDLIPSTSYQVQAQAACQAELDDPVWSSAVSFKTIYGIPFEENFQSLTALPSDWNRYNGLLSSVLAGTAQLAPASGWSFTTSAFGMFSKHIYANIYGTSSNKWITLPNIVMEDDVQLSFTLAINRSSSAATPLSENAQADDKFVVLASTDDGATWSILRQWDNAGSEYVYDSVSPSGEEVVINLSQFADQTVKIAFYGESTSGPTTGAGDNYHHIDNVLIDKVPTCLKPKALDISNISGHQAKLSWTAGDENQDAWQIALDTIAGFKPDTLSALIDVTQNPYILTDLLPQHTYYVYVRANCGTEDGVSRWTDVKSFTTTIACPAPTGLKATLTPGDGSIATLEWKENGLADAWRLEYSVNSNLSDSTVVLATDTFVNLTGLTSDTKYYARVVADCGELDGKSLYSSIISFTPTNRYELTINDGTTTNEFVPVYGYYTDNKSKSQFIVPATQLEAIQWDSIKSLTFYSSYANTNWDATRFEAYVAEVPATTMGDDIESWEALNKVMNEAALNIVDGKMVVTFDETYQYEGGNLLIGIKQTVSTTMSNAVHTYWYGVSATGASRGGYGNSISLRNFLPKMTIEYVPGIEPPCKNPTGLAITNISAFGATASWDEVEGANWEYAVLPATAEAPEAFSASTTAHSVNLESLIESTEYVFYLRKACGEDGNSEIVSIAFTTDVRKASLPYIEDFEGDAAGWKFMNGDEPNAWMIGNGAAKLGQKSLYVSNNGSDNIYTKDQASSTFAYLLIEVAEENDYQISYDWRANGDYSEDDGLALDYMRVALIPDAISFAAGDIDLPTGAIALDTRDEYVGLFFSEEWQEYQTEVHLTEGLYKFVVAWFNDDDADYGEDAPGAIDNISFVVKPEIPAGMDGINGEGVKAVKFIRNDKVYILVNGQVYNVTGQRVDLH